MKRFIFSVLLIPCMAFAYGWREGEPIPAEGLSNPYNWDETRLAQMRRAGLGHALIWPVDVTGVVIPERPLWEMLYLGSAWLGLHTYPQEEGEKAYFVPFPEQATEFWGASEEVGELMTADSESRRPNFRMGYSRIKRKGVSAVTFSCAACHSANLFGRRVMGLTNRFPRANEVFVLGIESSQRVSKEMFRNTFNADEAETELYLEMKERLKFVEAKRPVAYGLDTSLAHVALSLSHRAPDAWATMDSQFAENPREEPLRHAVADSKPAVWWNVKYKNKWLLDGSVVSGNPIFTNLLWNEIGRGTDLYELDQWFRENPDVIEELTTAVYASVPPRLEDFVDPRRIDLDAAKRGEVLFNARCAQCHGTYEKAWNLPHAEELSIREKLQTVRFVYHEDTPVKDVGTDPSRYQAMTSLAQLNRLEISKRNDILIRPQVGYVPPPLLGIWARYPYLHNNSIPNLCELLRPASERVTRYWSGPAGSLRRDFDFDCNGYPVRDKTPPDWVLFRSRLYDTRLPGMSNQGHDRDMAELTESDRRDLVKFLQTL